MNFDFSEAREIIEAAKKRGAIRGPGSDDIPDAAPQAVGDQEKRVVMPEWLQGEIKTPTARERSTPTWRSE